MKFELPVVKDNERKKTDDVADSLVLCWYHAVLTSNLIFLVRIITARLILSVIPADKPKVRLQMDPNVGLERLQEGMDIGLGCSTDANPPVRDIQWQLNGRALIPQDGVTLHKEALAIQGARLRHVGNYTCSAANREGVSLSNIVHLRLKRKK